MDRWIDIVVISFERKLRKVLCASTEGRARVLKKTVEGHSSKEVKTEQIVTVY